MRGLQTLAGLVAITTLTSPALAGARDAALWSSSDHSQAQTSIFTGVTYRVGFGRKAGERRGRASLTMGPMSHRPAVSELRIGQGIELTGGKTGKPALHVAGQDVGEIEESSQRSGTNTALIVAGVVILVGAVVAAAVIADDTKCTRTDCE